MFRIPDTTRLLKNSRRTGVAVAACLSAAALVAGCGGGDRVKAFQPTQIIAFGDEHSAFDDTSASGTPLVSADVNGTRVAYSGSRYTINVLSENSWYCSIDPGVNTAETCPLAQRVLIAPTGATFTVTSSSFKAFTGQTAQNLPLQVVNQREVGSFSTAPTTQVWRTTDRFYDCSPNSVSGLGGFIGNWVQLFAKDFGTGLTLGGTADCPQDSGNGRSYAAWGAKVDQVQAQKDLHRGELHDGVLVTILAGQNDIMAAFDEVVLTPATEEAALIRMREKGAQLAGVINDIITTGARVVFLTVPDMGKSPKAVAAGKSGLATELTKAFNEGYNNLGGLVLSVTTNGHKIVKVDGYTQIQNLAASYGSTAACDIAKTTLPDGAPIPASPPELRIKAALLNCTSNTLVGTTDFSEYLWADETHLAPVGHNSLAAIAIARVRDQL
ncbi:SGNH/GDSL hydrolase family protein [Aquabacterium sp.]|uniref:SGNH/GDSL hydrolase family protein n=1 Tax=Aquabacterium sp. TaxID=1872578 RepID=UPI002489F231|nr:SGNH/GDSL hydrolase family protein [Aquabacterium sp.]MDI1260054.1 SGNH/GDSL hydrolase family protein [Aquabacterium sp.]